MVTQSPSHTSRDLSGAIALLTDVQQALEENELIEEARIVSNHLQQLTSPHFESQIEEKGIEPVLFEMAQSFSSSVA